MSNMVTIKFTQPAIVNSIAYNVGELGTFTAPVAERVVGRGLAKSVGQAKRSEGTQRPERSVRGRRTAVVKPQDAVTKDE